MSKLIEKHLARLAARLEPKPVQQNITKILEQHVQRHDPSSEQLRAQYSAHFDDLFSGLTTLQQTPSVSPAALVHQIESAPPRESLELFKTAYYHGTLTPRLASAALCNPSLKVYEIASMFRLVESGGTLVKWSHGEKLFFELQTASRFWSLKYQALSRQIICDSVGEHWEWVVASIDRMPVQRTRNLVQAARAASPQLAAKLLGSCSAIRPLWIMWAEFRSGELREAALGRLESVLHGELVGVLRSHPLHPVLLKATPATESQVMDVLVKAGIEGLCDLAEADVTLLSLSER